jgi:5-methylcytosine-specific restriction endonuclease McrA
VMVDTAACAVVSLTCMIANLITVSLQFGGDNEACNLWTLCLECHAGKSSREAATAQPDVEGNEVSGANW